MTRDDAILAGYSVYQRNSHVGPRWTWGAPAHQGGGILSTEKEAWDEVMVEFERELIRARSLTEMFGSM